MKKLCLGIGLFINSFLVIICLNLLFNYETTAFEESGIENLASIFFVPILLLGLSIILFIIDIGIIILAIKYLKNSELILFTFNINKVLDLVEIIIFFAILLFASKTIISHNWFGLILSIFIASQIYLYVMWTWNIYIARKLSIQSTY